MQWYPVWCLWGTIVSTTLFPSSPKQRANLCFPSQNGTTIASNVPERHQHGVPILRDSHLHPIRMLTWNPLTFCGWSQPPCQLFSDWLPSRVGSHLMVAPIILTMLELQHGHTTLWWHPLSQQGWDPSMDIPHYYPCAWVSQVFTLILPQQKFHCETNYLCEFPSPVSPLLLKENGVLLLGYTKCPKWNKSVFLYLYINNQSGFESYWPNSEACVWRH